MKGFIEVTSITDRKKVLINTAWISEIKESKITKIGALIHNVAESYEELKDLIEIALKPERKPLI